MERYKIDMVRHGFQRHFKLMKTRKKSIILCGYDDRSL